MKLPQVSLRELFLLVALAAMGCGWWVDHRFTKVQRDRLSLWPKEPGDKLRVWIEDSGREGWKFESEGRIAPFPQVPDILKN
jgi:hypothetical protein